MYCRVINEPVRKERAGCWQCVSSCMLAVVQLLLSGAEYAVDSLVTDRVCKLATLHVRVYQRIFAPYIGLY
jgi:hypothetical protein